MRTRLVSYKDYYGHVSQDTVNEFENSVKASHVPAQLTSSLSRRLGKRLLRVITRYGRLPFVFLRRGGSRKFCIIMGLEFYKCFLAFLFNRDNSVYFFDAWSHHHAEIERFIRLMRLKHVFFSSQQVTGIFSEKKLAVIIFQWVWRP